MKREPKGEKQLLCLRTSLESDSPIRIVDEYEMEDLCRCEIFGSLDKVEIAVFSQMCVSHEVCYVPMGRSSILHRSAETLVPSTNLAIFLSCSVKQTDNELLSFTIMGRSTIKS